MICKSVRSRAAAPPHGRPDVGSPLRAANIYPSWKGGAISRRLVSPSSSLSSRAAPPTVASAPGSFGVLEFSGCRARAPKLRNSPERKQSCHAAAPRTWAHLRFYPRGRLQGRDAIYCVRVFGRSKLWPFRFRPSQYALHPVWGSVNCADAPPSRDSKWEISPAKSP